MIELSSVRIAKYIASAGLCSRRATEALIEEGRVKVDGQVITSPALNVGPKNIIEINGQVIKQLEKARVWLLLQASGFDYHS